MWVLFADIDGVLNSWEGWLRDKPKDWMYLTPECLDQFKVLLAAIPKVRIVISSNWRFHADRKTFKSLFNSINLPGNRIVGETPKRVSSRLRGYEIGEWLKDHPSCTKFVILDDDNDMVHLMPYLVQTDGKKGLQKEQVDEIIRRFNDPTYKRKEWPK